MNSDRKYRLLIVCKSEQHKTRVQPFGHALREKWNAEVESVVLDSTGEIGQIVKPDAADLILSTWCSDSFWMSEVASFGNQRGVNVACVRFKPMIPRRVLVLASGGGYALKGFDLASIIAAAWNIPITILHVMTSKDGLPGIRRQQAMRSIYRKLRLQLDMMAVDAQIVVRKAMSVQGGVRAEVQPADIVLMGGPATWLVSSDFIGSIPYHVARAVSNPLVMITPRRSELITLKEVFWQNTIRLDLKAETLAEAIAELTDALIEEKQILPDWRNKIISTALEREQSATTSFGSNIAVPHAAIEEATGITGCLGIYPSGIQSPRKNSNSAVHLVFLLITPKHDYTEYLQILAQIAGVARDTASRRKLVNSRTPDEAAELLEGTIAANAHE